MTMEEMFKAFTFHRAPSTVIEVVNGLRLPQDYLEFMKVHNGGEGAIGENGYTYLFKLKELEDVNHDYDVENMWPGHIVIGSDMGGMLLSYDTKNQMYCQIDSCNTEEDTFSLMTESFKMFFECFDKDSEK